MGGSGRICTEVVIWEDFIEILSRIFDFIESNDFFLEILENPWKLWKILEILENS